MNYTPEQITYAAMAWHATARRQWWKRNPNADDCPIVPWDTLTSDAQVSFRRCALAALVAVEPANVVKMRERLAEQSDQGQR